MDAKYYDPLLIDAIYVHKYVKKNWDLQQIVDVYNIVEKLALQFSKPLDIIKKHNFSVVIDERGNPAIFHAQCINEKHLHQIEINREWIKRYGVFIGEEKAYAMHVAHETFHILEDYEGVKELFPFHKQDIFLEIGAHTYARMLTNCNYHPQIIEYLYRISQHEISEEQLQNYFNRKIEELQQCHIKHMGLLLNEVNYE